jgi:hypothetical protein
MGERYISAGDGKEQPGSKHIRILLHDPIQRRPGISTTGSRLPEK